MGSEISAPTQTGEFTLPYLQSLHYFCTKTSQKLIHPDYFDHQANWYRLVRLDDTPVTINVSPEGRVQWSCRGAIERSSVQEVVNRLLISFPLPEAVLHQLPQELETRFRTLSPLVHITSFSLGEALIKAIIRQVITVGHAKKLTDTFIKRYGERQVYDSRTYYDFPPLEAIAKISLEELQAEGLGFKARVVQRAALSILENDLEVKVANMTPEEVLDKLTSIKGIGRWTAHVTLCDLFADWSHYPFEDLAVRTWARKLWSDMPWPQDERHFATLWRHINGTHVGIVTFYLLSCAATQQTPQHYAQEVLF